MRALTRIGILVALVALVVGALAATGVANPLGKGSQPEKVKVLDDFFKPTNVKIKKNKKVTWKWGQDFNQHNVTLKKGPKGVKKSKPCTGGKITKCNKSGSGTIGIKFNPKFNKKGTYNFVCTVHPTTMKVKVVVKK